MVTDSANGNVQVQVFEHDGTWKRSIEVGRWLPGSVCALKRSDCVLMSDVENKRLVGMKII